MNPRTLRLIPHSDCPEPAVRTLAVEVAPHADGLALRYVLDGDIEALAIPAPAPAARRDELWRHTCFEAFFQQAEGYREFNLAPSAAWACYDFSAYRVRAPDPDLAAPQVRVTRAADRLELSTVLPIRAGRLALTAVIENRQGGVSYWALAHAPGKPDFHHTDGFVLDLDSP